MKLKTILLGASFLMAGASIANAADVFTFPPRLNADGAAPEAPANMQRSPLNPNKDLGTNIFGYTTLDYDGVKHYVNFWTTSPNRLNKINEITIPGGKYDDALPRDIGCVAGAWCGNAYYAYRLFYYTYETRVIDWVKVDPATGQSYQEHIWNETGAADPSWWSVTQSLVWNPNEPNKVYALCRNTDGTVTSVFKEVNTATGQQSSPVHVFSKYYFAAAFDYDNQLYALTWAYDTNGNITGTILDILDEDFEIKSSTPIKVDNKEWRIYWDNNLTFDYTTGDLWWNAVQIKGENSEEIRLVKIDPLTKTTENFGALGINENIGGMYIDYVTAEHRSAPAQVKNADFAIDNAGNTSVTLKWTNPTTTWNRRTLSNLSSVEIYRDAYPGTAVGTVAATGKEGAAMEWTDASASNGIHTYYIVPVNASGKGVPYKLDAFVGKDVPGPVQNVSISTPNGTSIHLTWDKPVRGDNDGWFDDSDLTYTIVRQPDNVTVGTTKETSYDDNTIGEAQRYHYEIYASNAQGKGSAAVSDPLLAGSGIRPPFATDFMTKLEADRFSALDLNGDGNRFIYDFNTHLQRYTYQFIMSNYDNDDVLVSPTLLVEKGKTYKLTYYAYLGGFGQSGTREDIPQPIRIIGGTAPTADGMKDVLFEDLEHTNSFPAVTEEYVAYFTAPIDGEYYVGYELLTKNEPDLWLYMEGFAIDIAPADDLEARTVNAHLYLSTIADNEFNVEVYNNGENNQNAYTVKLAVLNGSEAKVFAETSNVPVAKAHETVNVKMYAKMPALGEQKLVAIVDLANDGNANNDMTAPLVVQCDETYPLNLTVVDPESEELITNIPFNHYFVCTATQTIYSPELTQLDMLYPNQKPVITRIAWEGNSLKDVNPFEDTQLTVYVSQTEEEYYSADEGVNFLPIPTTPVFEDVVPLKSGRNYVVVDFEEEFEFDPLKSIVVTVLKEDMKHSDWLFGWRQSYVDWGSPIRHSITCTGAEPMNTQNPTGKFTAFPGAPVLHLAIKGDKADGAELIIADGKVVRFNRATSSVETAYPVASVEVYNQAGQLVDRANGNGECTVHVNPVKGVCVMKVTGLDGKVVTFKTIF